MIKYLPRENDNLLQNPLDPKKVRVLFLSELDEYLVEILGFKANKGLVLEHPLAAIKRHFNI